MRHLIVKYDRGRYVMDDCGCVYRITKIGTKYYHLKCVKGNGMSGEYYIADVDSEFKEAMHLSDNDYMVLS